MLKNEAGNETSETLATVASTTFRGWNVTVIQLDGIRCFPYEWRLEKDGVTHSDPTSHISIGSAETEGKHAVDLILAHGASERFSRTKREEVQLLATSTRSVPARDLQEDMWLACSDPRNNQRVVDTGSTRDGQIRVHVDYGNGGEPGTLFFEPEDLVLVTK